MTHAWLMNAVGLLSTTVGALLILLHLVSPSRFVEEFRTPEAQRAYASHRRQIAVAVALLCLWLLVQDVAFLLL
jgi:hypothetical protein